MTEVPAFDHVALAIPNLDEQVERLTTMLGFVVDRRSEHYALVSDPASGIKFELSESSDGEAHFRHLGFRTPDVDGAHSALIEAGMISTEAPHRRDFASMYTSFLKEASGLEVQLVKYD